MLRTETIEYDVDGTTMVGYLAVDDSAARPGATRPGVLLSHEGAGQDDNVRSRAERLAACWDTWPSRSTTSVVVGSRRWKRSSRKIRALSKTRRGSPARPRGLDVPTVQPGVDGGRLAAIGFCFGGTMSLELARDGAPFQAVVGFHPGLYAKRPEDSTNIIGSVLMCCGADDPIIPIESRNAFENEMRAANVADWHIEVYGGVGHSFTNPAIGAAGFAWVRLRRACRSPLVAVDAPTSCRNASVNG